MLVHRQSVNGKGVNGKSRWLRSALRGFSARQDYRDWLRHNGGAELSDRDKLQLEIEWLERRARSLLQVNRALNKSDEAVGLHRQLRQQGLAIDSAMGQAFVAGWVNGTGRTALQVPLFLDEELRQFYIAGFMGRRF